MSTNEIMHFEYRYDGYMATTAAIIAGIVNANDGWNPTVCALIAGTHPVHKESTAEILLESILKEESYLFINTPVMKQMRYPRLKRFIHRFVNGRKSAQDFRNVCEDNTPLSAGCYTRAICGCRQCTHSTLTHSPLFTYKIHIHAMHIHNPHIIYTYTHSHLPSRSQSNPAP